MSYTVITKTGKIKQFYIKEVAEMYRTNMGGVVFSQQTAFFEHFQGFYSGISPRVLRPNNFAVFDGLCF